MVIWKSDVRVRLQPDTHVMRSATSRSIRIYDPVRLLTFSSHVNVIELFHFFFEFIINNSFIKTVATFNAVNVTKIIDSVVPIIFLAYFLKSTRFRPQLMRPRSVLLPTKQQANNSYEDDLHSRDRNVGNFSKNLGLVAKEYNFSNNLFNPKI